MFLQWFQTLHQYDRRYSTATEWKQITSLTGALHLYQEHYIYSNSIQGSLCNDCSIRGSAVIQLKNNSFSGNPITFFIRPQRAGCFRDLDQSQQYDWRTTPAPCALNVGSLVSSHSKPQFGTSLDFLFRMSYYTGNQATPPPTAALFAQTNTPKDDGWLLARRM